MESLLRRLFCMFIEKGGQSVLSGLIQASTEWLLGETKSPCPDPINLNKQGARAVCYIEGRKGQMKWHPGIRIDKIPVTATVGGLIFVIGIIVLGIVGVPAIRVFVLIGIPGGVLIAAFLYWWRNRS